jgi:hypothetical protein
VRLFLYCGFGRDKVPRTASVSSLHGNKASLLTTSAHRDSSSHRLSSHVHHAFVPWQQAQPFAARLCLFWYIYQQLASSFQSSGCYKWLQLLSCSSLGFLSLTTSSRRGAASRRLV